MQKNDYHISSRNTQMSYKCTFVETWQCNCHNMTIKTTCLYKNLSHTFFSRDFVKHTISSYKTTADLIEAMKEVEPELNEKEEYPKDVRIKPQDLPNDII